MKQFDFKRIKKFREDAGMTQDSLAIAMSTPKDRVFTQQISEWENRIVGGINVSSLIKLCNILNKQPDDFFIDNKV